MRNFTHFRHGALRGQFGYLPFVPSDEPRHGEPDSEDRRDDRQDRRDERQDRRDDRQDRRDDRQDREEREDREPRFKRLLGDLLDSGQAIRRGSTDLVTGVASSTKEEVVRIFSSEVRNFLDKMDVVELAQEIVAGLVIDMRAEVRFSRDDRGNVKATTTRNTTKVRSRGEEPDPELDDESEPEEKEAPRPNARVEVRNDDD